MLCVLVEANQHSSWGPIRRILESGGVPACSFIAPVDVLALLLPTQLNLYCYPKHMHFALRSQIQVLMCFYPKLIFYFAAFPNSDVLLPLTCANNSKAAHLHQSHGPLLLR